MIRLPTRGAVGAAGVALLAAACGGGLRALPTGPASPAADGTAAFEQAVAGCRRVTSLSAELRVSGSAAGQRLRGRVLVGLAAPASALLDAAAPFGASLFIYAARDAEVTLLLPRDQRVLRHDDAAAVLEAVTGVPLAPADLRRVLTGCAFDGPGEARAYGREWRGVRVSGGEAFLHRADGVWRLVSLVRQEGASGGWRADYDAFEGAVPHSVRLVSADGGRRFDVRLQLSQVEMNPVLGPDVFDVRIPATVSPITLDELRRAGPLSESTR